MSGNLRGGAAGRGCPAATRRAIPFDTLTSISNNNCPVCKTYAGRKSGWLAQLGERRVRNAEVGGSIPPPSTIFLDSPHCCDCAGHRLLPDAGDEIRRRVSQGSREITTGRRTTQIP
jgi:hypothetical protein